MNGSVSKTCWLVLVLCGLSACKGEITSPGQGGDGNGFYDDGGNWIPVDAGAAALQLSPSATTVAPGGGQTFTALRSGAAVTVDWSVEEGSEGGTITSGGEYTAPNAEGTYTVVAVDSGSGERAEATVTVAALAVTTHGMAIPASHPRLWFTPSRLARAREWFQAHPFTPPNSEDSGNGYGDVALHGLLTNNSTGSCTTAINWALANVSSKVPSTGNVSCDNCRWAGEQLILIYDWCHSYFTEQQRTQFASAMTAGLRFWSQNPWGGPAMYQNNYYWGYLRNELEWAITAYDEDPDAAEAMLDWVFDTRLAANFNPSTEPAGCSRGGVASEGSEYGLVIGAYPVVPFVTANLLGRDIYGETEFWREAVYAVIHSTTPGPTKIPGMGELGYTVFSYSDDGNWTSRFQAQLHYYPDFMTSMASYWATEAVGRHARQWANMVGVAPWRHIQATDVETEPLTFDTLPLDFYSAGPRYLYGRNAWGASSTAFMLQLGDPNGDTIGHQHTDYGTFQIWRGGRFLSHETASYGDYVTGYGGSGSVEADLGIGHNTVLINTSSVGMGSNPGPRYPDRVATIERLESQDGYTFAVANLAPPATQMAQWRREFVFVRSLETLVIFDRIEAHNASDTRTFINHCETSPTGSGNASRTCTMDTQALTMTTLLPAQRTYRVVDEGSSSDSQYRIEVDTTPGTEESYILTVLEARNASDTPLSPSVTDNGTSYAVTLGSTVITFQKGMTSTGGSIQINGTTTPFRSGVQTMSVTADGPRWN